MEWMELSNENSIKQRFTSPCGLEFRCTTLAFDRGLAKTTTTIAARIIVYP